MTSTTAGERALSERADGDAEARARMEVKAAMMPEVYIMIMIEDY